MMGRNAIYPCTINYSKDTPNQEDGFVTYAFRDDATGAEAEITINEEAGGAVVGELEDSQGTAFRIESSPDGGHAWLVIDQDRLPPEDEDDTDADAKERMVKLERDYLVPILSSHHATQGVNVGGAVCI